VPEAGVVSFVIFSNKSRGAAFQRLIFEAFISLIRSIIPLPFAFAIRCVGCARNRETLQLSRRAGSTLLRIFEKTIV
jgi:hypothetical protein